MAFRVQEFRAQMNYDGARPNLFNCEIAFPLGLGGAGNGAAQQQFTFMARASQIPGDTIGVAPQFYFGRELKFAGNRTFSEWTVTVVNDEDYKTRDTFEKWMSAMNSHVGNLRNENFIKGDGGYQADGYITAMGKAGPDIKAYKFIGLFPIDLSPMEMDWGANDTIQEYAVTFAYQWWEWADGQNGPTTDMLGNGGNTPGAGLPFLQ